jgi:hypothetical protein
MTIQAADESASDFDRQISRMVKLAMWDSGMTQKEVALAAGMNTASMFRSCSPTWTRTKNPPVMCRRRSQRCRSRARLAAANGTRLTRSARSNSMTSWSTSPRTGLSGCREDPDDGVPSLRLPGLRVHHGGSVRPRRGRARRAFGTSLRRDARARGLMQFVRA